MSPAVLAGSIFVLAYAGIVAFKRHKSQIVWGAIGLGVLLGLVRGPDVLHDINWNVMGIFAGTLLISEYFILSRVPDAVSYALVRRTHTVGTAYLVVCVIASVLSIFIENVAVVLIVAPIMLGIAKRIGVSPVPGMIGIAICSNLQGTATLIGDPPSMILGTYMRMNFADFFFYHGKPGIFFAVQVGAAGALLFLRWLFGRFRNAIAYAGEIQIRSMVPTACLVVMVIALSFGSLVDPEFLWFGGTVCMALAILCIPLSRFAHKPEHEWVLKHYDWDTTFFLAGIFVIVGMLERAGVIEGLAAFLAGGIGADPLVAFCVVVGGSVALSAFIDNVPFVTAMIPAVQLLAEQLGIGTELLVFGLLIGASVGGNVTPIGASANIVAVALLKKQDIHVSFREFVKVGLPFTIIATILASAFIYLVWR